MLAVDLRDGGDTRGLIAKTLVGAGFDVLELMPERLRLDDAFMQLTEGIVQ
jgi:hypothetical protein